LLAGRLGEYRAAYERIARHSARAGLADRAALGCPDSGVGAALAEADSVASATIALDSTFMLAWTWRASALLAWDATRTPSPCSSGMSR
jgi:hypothetical protein